MSKNSSDKSSLLESGWFWVPLAFAVYWWTWLQKIDFHPHEADVYFHHALSRILPWHGVLRSLPQVDDLEWGTVFPEKEYLFHFITRNLWALGGDPIFMLTAPLMMLGTVTLLLGPGMVGVGWMGRFLATFMTVGWSPFIWRSVMLRPHQGAILTFSALLVSVLRAAPRFALVAGVLSPLFYHAIHFPLALLAAAWVVLPREVCAAERRAVQSGALGILIGTLVHPYFPGNLLVGWEHAKISLITAGLLPGGLPVQEPIPFGGELFPRVATQYIRDVFPAFISLAFWFAISPFSREQLRDRIHEGISLLLPVSRRKAEVAPAAKGAEWVTFWLVIVSSVLCILMGFGPRIIEYLAPVMILLVGRLTELQVGRVTRGVWILLVSGLLAQGMFGFHRSTPKAIASFDSTDPAARVVNLIPQDAKGAKVFNCEWDFSPFIFDARPDLKFVDILDPSFLISQAPKLYEARMGLNRGEYADAYPLLRGVFGADYVLCSAPGLISVLASDPRFERLSPSWGEMGTVGPWLFAVRPPGVIADRFIRNFEVSPLTAEEVRQRGSLRPRNLNRRSWYPIKVGGVPAGRGDIQPAQVSFHDLKAQLPAKISESLNWETHQQKAGVDCVWFRPLIGSERESGAFRPGHLLVGGGPDLRIWEEEAPLFTSRGDLLRNHLVQYVIEGSIPVERLVGLACSHTGVPYAAWSIGSLSPAELDKECPRKERSGTQWRADSEASAARPRCFAPVITAH